MSNDETAPSEVDAGSALRRTPETFSSSTAAARSSSPGRDDALYERHLMFDNVVDLDGRGTARAVRGRRPLRPRRALAALAAHRADLRAREPQARLLPVDGVPHRPLAGQQHHRTCCSIRSRKQRRRRRSLDWLAMLEQEPDAGLGNGGLGRLAACFLDSMATMQLPAMGYGLRYEYGIFKQTIEDGWQHEQPDNWLRRPDPWEVARPHETGRGPARLLVRDARRARCASIRGPAVDSDRHAVRPPGRRLRRQDDQHAAPLGRRRARLLRLPGVQQRRLRRRAGRDARGRIPDPRALSRRLDAAWARACASCRSISSSPARWPISCGASGAATPTGPRLPDKVAIQLNDTHPALAVPELMRILLDEAKLGWDQAWDLTQRTLAYTNHTLLPEALEKWPLRVVRDAAAAPSGDHLRDQPPLPR